MTRDRYSMQYLYLQQCCKEFSPRETQKRFALLPLSDCDAQVTSGPPFEMDIEDRDNAHDGPFVEQQTKKSSRNSRARVYKPIFSTFLGGNILDLNFRLVCERFFQAYTRAL